MIISDIWDIFLELHRIILYFDSPYSDFRSDVIDLMTRVKKIITEHEILTGEAFETNDIPRVRQVVGKMQYFVNLRDQLIKKETEMGIVN